MRSSNCKGCAYDNGDIPCGMGYDPSDNLGDCPYYWVDDKSEEDDWKSSQK